MVFIRRYVGSGIELRLCKSRGHVGAIIMQNLRAIIDDYVFFDHSRNEYPYIARIVKRKITGMATRSNNFQNMFKIAENNGIIEYLYYY